MGGLGQRSGPFDDAAAVGENGKVRASDVIGVVFNICSRSGFVIYIFVQREQELEAKTGFIDECPLNVFEANCLGGATASPGGRHEKHVVLAIEVPEVVHCTALVHQSDVVDGVAQIASC